MSSILLGDTLPGTNLPIPEGAVGKWFQVLHPIFAVSGGGLSLSQVAEMTGLHATTIQNWVKRGWVERPTAKKYDENQVARILLINLLRPSMQIEKIVGVLTYINGRVDDRSDDIIPEPQLYNILCYAMQALESCDLLGEESLDRLVARHLARYEGPVPDAKQRLSRALAIFLLQVAATSLMQKAEALATAARI